MREKICGCDDFAGGFICKAVGSRYIKEGAGLSGTVHGHGPCTHDGVLSLACRGQFRENMRI